MTTPGRAGAPGPAKQPTIAVIGMAGVFPDAANLDEFYANLAAGRDSVRDLSPERKHFSSLAEDEDYQVTAALDRIDLFDFRFFGLSRREAELMDPHQRIMLQLVHALIENAGYAPSALRGSKTAVLLSSPRPEYFRLLPEHDPLALLGNVPAGLPGRVAHVFGLEGSTLAIETACNASLVAVHYACRELRSGDADLAVVGGVSVKVLPEPRRVLQAYREVMSESGRCRAFDAAADGTSDGEGGGLLLLKRLDRAVADGDVVHAVIKGTAVNHNGARSSSLAAPSPAAQLEVITRAWEQAGLRPSGADYIEAHGAGTRLGDAIEVQALGRALGSPSPDRAVAIGSVKTNIGHLDHAAGIAGLIKTILALEHRQLLPSLHFEEPNPSIDFERSGVEVNNKLRPWPARDDVPRRAGVSSFSLVGVNAHVVVEEAGQPALDDAPDDLPCLITVSAVSQCALSRLGELLADAIADSTVPLPVLAHTLNRGRDHKPYRAAFVCRTRAEAVERLKAIAAQPAERTAPAPGRFPTAVVFLCSGDVHVTPSQLKELAASHPAATAAWQEARRAREALPPGRADAAVAQYLVGRALSSLGIRPAALLGHGTGNGVTAALQNGADASKLADLVAAAPALPRPIDYASVAAVVDRLADEGRVVFVELVGRGALSDAVASAITSRDDSGVASAADLGASVLDVTAALYARGADLDWDTFYQGRNFPRVQLPTYPFEAVRCWCRPPGSAVSWDVAGGPGSATRPTPDQNDAVEHPADVTARRSTVTAIGEIWREVLKLPEVEPLSDYFELGGNSITAMEVLDLVRAQLGVGLAMVDLYDHPTLQDLAYFVDHDARKRDEAGTRLPPIEPIDRAGELPVSFGQERLWFLDQLEPRSAVYNLPVDVHFHGPIDVGILTRSLEALISRHEVLRSRLPTVGGSPALVIDPPAPLDLKFVDVSDAADADGAAAERIARETATPFDLATGPLYRAMLIRLASEDHVLVFTVHHAVDDGWSPGIINREFAEFYQAFREGREPDLGPLPISYVDYAAWQRSWLQGEVLERELSYWKGHLLGAERLNIPTDRPRPARQSHRGDLVRFKVEADLVTTLRSIASSEGTTLFSLLLAAFTTLLGAYSGQDDILVATPSAGRTRPETRGLLGFFNNTLALRTRIDAAAPFRALLRDVRQTVLGALAHQEVPFEKVVEIVRPARDLSANPLFNVMYVHQTLPQYIEEFAGLTVANARQGYDRALTNGVAPGTAKFDLLLSVLDIEGEAELPASLEFSSDLFDVATAERMAGHFRVLLASVAAGPDTPVGELELLTAAERHRLLVEWNDTEAAFPGDKLVHELFAEQAVRTPDAAAVVADDGQLTYRELDKRSARLAQALAGLGVGPDVVAGICLERSAAMVVAVLGVLRAGGAYVPLDPAHPDGRLAFVISDCGARVVVTQRVLAGRLPADVQAVYLDDPQPPAVRSPDDPEPPAAAAPMPGPTPTAGPPGPTRPDHLAYVMYTSGSTGVPKGVMIEHRGLVNRITWQIEALGHCPEDIFVHKTPFTFDVSVWEMLLPLCLGARLVVAAPGAHMDPDGLAELFNRFRVTVCHFVPSMLEAFLDARASETCSSLRAVVCSGEALSGSLQRRFFETFDCELFNLYGPTEASIDVTWWKCERSAVPLSIGRPIANTQIYMLNTDGRPAPIGVPGELHIGGIGLARGYIGRPDEDARFVARAVRPGTRLYRTGDLARFRADGTIEYLGRRDDQIKIRGQRVELGEIEATIATHPAIERAVVVAERRTATDTRLMAYVVAQDGTEPVRELRAHVRRTLPEYMCPAAFVTVDRIPLTPSGKAERRALADLGRPTEPEPHRPPGDDLERTILQAWEAVLDVGSIRVTDNFFDLGGHSLLAPKLMNSVEAATGVRLPLASLYEFPTVERQAALLRRTMAGQRADVLVRLQPAGSRPGFFCVHPSGGNVSCYGQLATAMGTDRPFLAIQSVGLTDAEPPLTQVGAMAERYLDAAGAVQPDGPYHFAGWSMGGVIAFEMARQALARGMEVGIVALIDSAPQARHEHSADDTVLLVELLAENFGWQPAAGELTPGGDVTAVLRAAQQDCVLPGGIGVPDVTRFLSVLRSNDAALGRYQPGTYPGPVTLFRVDDGHAHDLGWSAYVDGPLEIVPTAGDHLSVITVGSDSLALALRQRLEAREAW